jgi:hypothetical protein
MNTHSALLLVYDRIDDHIDAGVADAVAVADGRVDAAAAALSGIVCRCVAFENRRVVSLSFPSSPLVTCCVYVQLPRK